MEKNILLCREDFMDFAIGEFPYDRDHTATGEYHYLVEEGYAGNWYDPVVNYNYCGTGSSWIITEKDGKHYMESMRIEKNRPHRIFPTLETGSVTWSNIKLTAQMQRLSTKGIGGIFFNAISSLNGLVFSLEGKDKAVLTHRYKDDLIVLAEAAFPHDSDHLYELMVDCNGNSVDCYIDGVLILHAETELAARPGKIGITGDCPTRFGVITVEVTEEEKAIIDKRAQAAAEAETAEMAIHPKMKLWKRFSLKDFGTSRQLRFGHLTGTDEWFLVFAQMQKKVHQDAYGTISCLTAVNLDGEILWQIGEPSKKTAVIGKIAADMAFQVYDIDGDGIDEVIWGHDFEIQILDGRTGKVKKSAKTPLSDEDDADIIGAPYGIYAYDRLNPDGIRICNFSGKERPTDLLLKDRYGRVYAVDEDLNLMWKYVSPKNTGHCPLPVDINGDGYDEVLVGYTMLDHNGKEMWTYPIDYDHTDEIVMGKFRGDGKGYFACASGQEGFFVGDAEGNIVFRDRIGHAQRVSVAKYCKERDDFQLAVVNYWGHQGIIYLYDAMGNPLWELENQMNGNLLTPVNWDGSGKEMLLTNANAAKGGLLTGEGIRGVAFPDDGHPDFACEAVNLTGDERDELIVWDYNSCWIYTQEDNPKPQEYHPVKFPHYNASNYRGEYAYPDESYITFKK